MKNKGRAILLIFIIYTSVFCISCSSNVSNDKAMESEVNEQTISSTTEISTKEEEKTGESVIPTNSAELNVLPIISVGSNEIIGGFASGQWLDGKNISSNLSEIEYSVYKFDEVIGTGSAKFLEDNFIKQELSKGIDPDGVLWGLTGKHNPTPRKAYQQKANIDIYKNLVKGYMEEEGLLELKPDSIEIWRLDLEGDGIEEAIVVDSEMNENEAFSIVMLRKLVGDTVNNIVLFKDSDKYIEGEYAKGEPLIADPYYVSAILDLNGDGVMEVILEGYGFEAILFKVFEIKDNEAIEVIDYNTRRFWYKESYLEESGSN